MATTNKTYSKILGDLQYLAYRAELLDRGARLLSWPGGEFICLEILGGWLQLHNDRHGARLVFAAAGESN